MDDTTSHLLDLLLLWTDNDGDAFTVGITLDSGPRHSVFDGDGSAIIVHEKADAYGEKESDTGSRIACGVIRHS